MLQQNFKTAEELKISPELFDGLHLVLRAFERGELVWTHAARRIPMGFNMAHEWSEQECCTAGCILGWARHLSGNKFYIHDELNGRGAAALSKLYSPVRQGLLSDITLEQAEHALRSYLVTGHADWN